MKDIQDAADALRVVYDRTNKRDGYVSLEVSPFVAHDTQKTIADARRLWKAVNRPNIMIKVPGTEEGTPAIEQLIGEGININVTLLFSRDRYERVALAYVAGLKKYVAGGGDPSHVASVASFFISRIDALVDSMLKARIKVTSDPQESGQLRSLLGKVAIANGKLTYERYKQIFSGAGMGGAGEQRRADAARVVGQHQHQGPVLFGRALRRGADRPGYGEHDSAVDSRSVPRSRASARESRRGHRRGPQDNGHARAGGHLHEAGHGRIAGAGGAVVQRAVRQTAQRGGCQVQGGGGGRGRYADLQFAGRFEIAGGRRHRGLEADRQSAPFMGARCVTVDWSG